MDDDAFLASTAAALSGLTGVEAVALGGSRAQGTARPDSDWDLAVYYRGPFDPDEVRALGWPGHVSALGEWGGGVFNGGAWLTVAGRGVDLHYRDLDVVEQVAAEAARGRFHFEALEFHLTGIPSYLLLAELASNRVLHGSLPRYPYPEALRRNASRRWSERAAATLDYAAANHARHGRVAECAALTTVGLAQYAHAVLAARGEWITNDKRLLTAAGLREADAVTAGMSAEPAMLAAGVERARRLGAEALASALAD